MSVLERPSTFLPTCGADAFTHEDEAGLEDVPPLENGDHLTQPEFHRRYAAMPDVRAELIDGVVYMSSPVSVKRHGRQSGRMSGLFTVYVAATPGVDFADNSTVILDPGSEVQPDVFLWLDEAVGGQSRLDDEFLHGAPEFVVEVANSSAAIDLHRKLKVYAERGVMEYLVWLTREQRFVCFAGGPSQLAAAELKDGRFVSSAFPGLVIDTTALLSGDLAAALAAVQAGISSPEHAAFVAALQARRAAMPPA